MAAAHTSQWIAKGVLGVQITGVTGSGSIETAGVVGVAGFPDKTAQGTGTLNTGVWGLQGSNATTPTASVAWYDLSTPTGADISGLASAVVVQILENPRWIRAKASGSTGGTDLTVNLICYATPR